uniref:Uncharacterized protein n=1 Tax=Anguilla anguilla TaxID=7936 RepID=A0A0E9T2C6_ANGAN
MRNTGHANGRAKLHCTLMANYHRQGQCM